MGVAFKGAHVKTPRNHFKWFWGGVRGVGDIDSDRHPRSESFPDIWSLHPPGKKNDNWYQTKKTKAKANETQTHVISSFILGSPWLLSVVSASLFVLFSVFDGLSISVVEIIRNLYAWDSGEFKNDSAKWFWYIVHTTSKMILVGGWLDTPYEPPWQ